MTLKEPTPCCQSPTLLWDRDKALYDERTQANKDAKTASAQAIGILIPAGTPAEEVSIASLMAELIEIKGDKIRNLATLKRIEQEIS